MRSSNKKKARVTAQSFAPLKKNTIRLLVCNPDGNRLNLEDTCTGQWGSMVLVYALTLFNSLKEKATCAKCGEQFNELEYHGCNGKK